MLVLSPFELSEVVDKGAEVYRWRLQCNLMYVYLGIRADTDHFSPHVVEICTRKICYTRILQM